MKKILYFILGAAALMNTSCSEEDVLEVNPTKKIDASSVFSSVEAVNAFRIGMYGNIAYGDAKLYTTQLPLLYDIMGNDMVYGYTWYGSWNNAFNYKVGKTSSETSTVWSQCYYFQEIANTMLTKKFVGIDENVEKQYKAEARALRGMVHVDVARFYGKAYHLDKGASLAIPYVDYVDYDALPARDNMKTIYEKAIKDLTDAIPDLPEAKGSAVNYMNKNAAYVALARIYADMHEFGKARDYARLAIGDKSLLSTEEYKLGLSTDNDESILCFYTDKDKYYKYRVFTSFHDSYDGMGDDFLANSSLTELFADNDVRKAFFIYEPYYYKYYDGNVYNGKTYSVSTLLGAAEASNGRGYYTSGKFPRKDVVMGSSRGSTGLGDYNAMRTSEMVLLIAECDAILGDNNTEAQDLLFDIESRSLPTAVKSTAVGSALVDLIRLETRKEMWGEGHALRYIKRWGIDLVRDGSQPEHNTIPAGDARYQWPVPERELNANPNLK